MSLDHGDTIAVSAFTDEVARRLGAGQSEFEPWTLRLLAVLVLSGALITLSVRTDGVLTTALYLAALVSITLWVAGFYLARDPAHWFRA